MCVMEIVSLVMWQEPLQCVIEIVSQVMWQ